MTARIVAKIADGLTMASTGALLLSLMVFAATLPPSRGLAGLAYGLIFGILLVGITIQIILGIALNVYKYVIAKRAQHSARSSLIASVILHILVMVLPFTLFLASFGMYSGSTSWKRFVTLAAVISCVCCMSNLTAMIALHFATNAKEA